MLPEKKLRVEVVNWLNSKRIFHFRIEDPSLSNYPDIVLCYNGLFIGIELKKDEETRARKGQLSVLNEIRISGGIGAVVGSLDKLKEIIEDIDKWEEYNEQDHIKTIPAKDC